MNPIRRGFVAGASRVSAMALLRFGHRLPIVVVNEYPKSGGTWLARLLSTVLDLPFLDNLPLPPVVPSVIRTHWTPRDGYEPSVYVVRDGRDALVSLLHHRVRRGGMSPLLHRRQAWLPFGKDLDQAAVRTLLPRFIESELTDPGPGSPLPWHQHVAAGTQAVRRAGGRRAVARYEDLLADPSAEVARVADALGFGVPARQLLAASVGLHDRALVGERVGDRYQTSYFRTGEAGGWRGAFSRTAGEMFATHANPTLLELGYESDPEWWAGLEDR